MSEALENKAVELLDKGGAALGQFSDKLMELGKQYGPEVIDAGLAVARIDALSTLVPSAIILTLTFFAVRAYVKNYAWLDKHWDTFMIGLFGGFALAAPCVWAFAQIFDIWRWVGIFEPKLWLAKKVLGL